MPPVPVLRPVRQIWSGENIAEEMARVNPSSMFPRLGFARIFGEFIAGHSLRVSQTRGGKRKDVELERLEAFAEVWLICNRVRAPGWRITGRFLSFNEIVLFRAYDKNEIGSSYQGVAGQLAEDRDTHFPGVSPHTGAWISGYISGEHHDVSLGKGASCRSRHG